MGEGTDMSFTEKEGEEREEGYRGGVGREGYKKGEGVPPLWEGEQTRPPS